MLGVVVFEAIMAKKFQALIFTADDLLLVIVNLAVGKGHEYTIINMEGGLWKKSDIKFHIFWEGQGKSEFSDRLLFSFSYLIPIIINLSVNKMLWKRHLSIYSSGTPKLGDQKKEFSKGKTTLAPLLSAGSTTSAQKTLDVTAPKFVIRKKSKSTKAIK